MVLFWLVATLLILLAIREYILVDIKQDPCEYVVDENGNEYVKDNTDA